MPIEAYRACYPDTILATGRQGFDMRRELVVLGLLGAILLGGCAAPEVVCSEPMRVFSAWIEDVRGRNPGLADRRLTEGERRLFLKRYNALLPPTRVTGEEIHLVARADVGYVLVAFVSGGCISATRCVGLDVMTYLLSPEDAGTSPQSRIVR